MKKISDSLQEIITDNPFLNFGFRHQLFNLSQLSKFLVPLIAVRSKKEVSSTAVLMSLSRLTRITPKFKAIDFKVNNLAVHYNLFSATFIKSDRNQIFINKLYNLAQAQNAYLTLSYGRGEITVITEEIFLNLIKKEKGLEAKSLKNNLVSMGVQFSPAYVNTPGFLYYLIQQVSLQNINICEIASTFTELIFYVNQADAKIVFETLSLLLKK